MSKRISAITFNVVYIPIGHHKRCRTGREITAYSEIVAFIDGEFGDTFGGCVAPVAFWVGNECRGHRGGSEDG